MQVTRPSTGKLTSLFSTILIDCSATVAATGKESGSATYRAWCKNVYVSDFLTLPCIVAE